MMSDDNLILHNLYFITAHFSVILHICAVITPYFRHCHSRPTVHSAWIIYSHTDVRMYIQVIIYQQICGSFGISRIDNGLSGQQCTFVLEYPSLNNQICYMEGFKGVVLAVDSHKLTSQTTISCLELPNAQLWHQLYFLSILVSAVVCSMDLPSSDWMNNLQDLNHT